MDYKKILAIFLIFYFGLLIFTRTTTISHDEGAQAMDSLFYNKLFKDFNKNPNVIFNLRSYAFNFYAQSPAIYIIYHPPLYNLITALLFFIFGMNFLTTKLLTMSLSIGSIYMIFLIGKKLYNKKIGFYAAIVTSLATFFLYYSRLSMLDIPLVFFVLLSIYLYKKASEGEEKYFYYLGISLGLAFLMRYHILITGIFLFFYYIYQWKGSINLKNILKTLIPFTIISLPFWIVLIFFKGLQAVFYYINMGGIGRCEMFLPICNTFTHLYYYPSVIFFQIFPIIFLLPLFYFLWKRNPTEEDKLLISFTIFYFIATTLTSMKQPKYILPVLPIFSLLFVKTSFQIKKYGKYILIFALIGEIIMTILTPNPLTKRSILKADAEPAAKYVNQRINKNANIFLASPTMPNAIVFNFASVNNFKNGIVRERRGCYHNKFNRTEYLDYLNKYNIQFIIGKPKRSPLKEIVKTSFKKIAERGNYKIYRRNKKINYTTPNKVCNYNCKLKRNFCTTI